MTAEPLTTTDAPANTPLRVVASLTDDPAGALPHRARQMTEAYYAAHQALEAELKHVGVPTHDTSPYTRCFFAGLRLASFWEARTKRLERTLRVVLAAELSETLRAQVATALRGRPVPLPREPISEKDQVFLTHYQTADAQARSLLRQLASRLTAHREATS